MLRSAAKNNDAVTVVCDPADYDAILEEMRLHEGATLRSTRRRLAAKVFTRTAAYDSAISTWLNDYLAAEEPAVAAAAGEEGFQPPCGPHPQPRQDAGAALRREPAPVRRGLPLCRRVLALRQLRQPAGGRRADQGKPLSYNNFLDADAAWNAVREFDEPAVVILKHQNPCGSAVAEDVTTAYDRAFACDPKSAFGGIIAVNREVPLSLVEHFADQNKQFVEVIIAPSYTPEALERLSKRSNLRVLATGGAAGHARLELRSVDGGHARAVRRHR